MPSGFDHQKKRHGHSSVFIDGDIFVWGGWQDNLPNVHLSDVKLRLLSVVEVFRGKKGR